MSTDPAVIRQAVRDVLEERDNAMEPQHRCEPIGVVDHCGPGRDWWIGRITRHVKGYEHETHCLHFTTPRKAFVLMVNAADIAAIYCLLGCAEPQPDAAWRQSQIDAYRRAAALRAKAHP
ncbi:MAG TPA: hypothetical protein VJY35_08945 [Candidatus Eisenbacteria bacterium]|nr:hypothetical protein [Candidatus Eisenbacteria bacterium]